MMKTLLTLTIAPLLCFVFGVVSDAQGQSEVQLPTQQQLSRLGLERAWWAQAALNPSRDIVKHLVIDEDAIYVQTSSGVTTAFDSETGRQKWAVQIGRFDEPSFRAVSNQDLVLIVSGSTMYAVEKLTGRTNWSLQLHGLPSTSPTLDDKQVYVGTINGSVYAYSLKKIRKLYEERRLPDGSEEALVWMYKAGKEITSPPIVSGRAVNFASRDGSLYSVSTDTSHLIYQLETDKPIVAPLARLDDTMFMTSEDHSFFALKLSMGETYTGPKSYAARKSANNGKVRWEFTSGLPIRKPIWAIAKDLYLLPDRGGMYCLNPGNGSRRWEQRNLSDFVAVLGSTLAAYDTDGNLVILSRDKGEIIGTLPMRRFTVRTGNDCTDRIFVATNSGLVVCLRQIGHQNPIYYRYPDRLPLLPEFAPEEGEESAPASETEMPASETESSETQ
jgi:outer membrane protein assembly factor BamB